MILRQPTKGEHSLLRDLDQCVNAIRAEHGEPPAADATEALMQAGVWLLNTIELQAAIEQRMTMAERDGSTSH